MKRLILVVLALVLWSAGCDRDGSEGDAEAQGAVAEERSVPIRVATVEELTRSQGVTYAGNVEAWEQAQITGATGSRIERIHVREGEPVRRGQVVAVMDDSNLRQAEVELRVARNDRDRLERLVEIGAVARQQLEQAEARFETAERNVSMLRQNTSLTSPIDGVVTALYFVPGEIFMAGAQAPSMMTIQQIDPLKVVIHVAERYFPVVRREMTAQVTLDTFGAQVFEGTVAYITPTVSPQTRSFQVEVQLDNSEGRLSPGMSTRVTLNLGETSGIFLPRGAIQSQPGSADHFVYVVEDGRAVRRAVEVGEQMEGDRRILSGLEVGEDVVIEGMGRLSDGAAVRVVETREAS